MKTIITGTQSFCKYPNLSLAKYTKNPIKATDALIVYEEEFTFIKSKILQFQEKEGHISRVLSLSKDGLDQSTEKWAMDNNVYVKRFKTQWMKDGKLNKRAGWDKLLEIVEEADAAIVFMKNRDSHSLCVIREMKRRGKKLFVVDLSSPLEQMDRSSGHWT